MNGKPKIPYKDLAYYQDDLLPKEERERIESILQDDLKSQQDLEQMRVLNGTLQSLGRRERIREKIHVAIKRPSPICEPFPGKGFSFFHLTPMAAFATVLVCLFGFWITQNYYSSPITLLQKTGQITWNDSQNKHIQVGDQIVSEKESYAQIRLADGKSILEIGPDTTAAFLDRRRIRVDRGVVCNNVGKDPSHPYQVQTPNGTVTVLGTIFEIEVSQKQTVVRVLEGKVQVDSSSPSAASTVVNAGHQAVMTDKSISSIAPFQSASFAPWRNKYHPQKLDIRNIADIISDSKAQP